MGGGSWSTAFYEEQAKTRAKTGADPYAYTSSVRSGKTVAKVHDLMNPMGVKIRESRDGADHVGSVPIILAQDVTGSMERVCRTIQMKLGTVMTLLVQKGYVTHPQLCAFGIGDARSDKAPLQVGQFESDNRIEQWLNEHLYIENGGGGQMPPSESYSLAMYFAARHTAHDAYDLRKRQGYFFMIGDEQAYDVSRHEVETIIGDKIERDISVAEIGVELKRLYNPFMIIPRDASHGRDPSIERYWVDTLGREHVIMLEDTEAIAETIATAVGVCEGTVDLDEAADHLKSTGASTALVKTVTNAVSDLAARSGGGLAKVGSGSIAHAGGKPSTTRKL